MRLRWYTCDKDGSVWSFSSSPSIIDDKFKDMWVDEWGDYEEIQNWNTEFSKPDLFSRPQWGDKPLIIDLDSELEVVVLTKEDFNKLAGVDND